MLNRANLCSQWDTMEMLLMVHHKDMTASIFLWNHLLLAQPTALLRGHSSSPMVKSVGREIDLLANTSPKFPDVLASHPASDSSSPIQTFTRL